MIDFLLPLAVVPGTDWSAGPTALQNVQTPLFAMLVIALIIAFAFAFYRVATGRKDQDDD